MACCAIEEDLDVQATRPADRILAALLIRWFVYTVSTWEINAPGRGANLLIIWCRHQESNLNLGQVIRTAVVNDIP